MPTQITGLTISGSEIKIDYSKGGGGEIKPLYGYWYYSAGCVCDNNTVKCPVTLNDYLSVLNVNENANFYLGNGSVNNFKSNPTFSVDNGLWCVDKIQNNKGLNIINFGGWGDCSSIRRFAKTSGSFCDITCPNGGTDCGKCSVKYNPSNINTYQCGQNGWQDQCQGPNEVWNDSLLQYFPTKK